ARALRRRSLHSSPGPGKPATWRREAGGSMAASEEVRDMRDAETTLAIIAERGMPRSRNEPPESRMMRKYPVRFGRGRMEKDAAGRPSLPAHYGHTTPGTSRPSPAAYLTSNSRPSSGS